jgi:O-antigen/teichoic acid export membrane protein
MVFLPMILMSVSIPVLVQEWESGHRDRFRSITFWICGLTLAVALPPAALVVLLSPWIMSLYGPGFRDGWMLLVLLVSAAPLHAIAKIASGALLGMNRAWRVLAINLVWGITLLALTAWLLPTHGVMGLAIAFVAAYALLGSLALTLVIVGSQTRPQAVPHTPIGPPQEII